MPPDFGEISERLRRSTVQVSSGPGAGSGVIASAGGDVITNAHVVRSASTGITLWDGRELPASLAARDTRRDLALLRARASDLPAATLGDSDEVRPGSLVIAVGNPLGFTGALTTGVVHGVGQVRGLGAGAWIQAAVRLAPGNSGGPLADAGGRVIGINSMVMNGLGLAVPSNAVAAFLRSSQARRRLGVTVRPVKSAEECSLLVLDVEPGSLADRASLLPGDMLTGAGGRPFGSLEDLGTALETGAPVLSLDFRRGDRTQARRVAIRMREAA